MLLAGDIGGTKTLLGLFRAGAGAAARPIEVGEFVTLEYDGLEPMIREFLAAQNVEPRRIEAACFGVAGAVTDQVARLTNVPWLVDSERSSERLRPQALRRSSTTSRRSPTASRCSSPTSSRCCSRASRIPTATPR